MNPNNPTGDREKTNPDQGKRLTIGLVAPLLWSRPTGFPMMDGVADAAFNYGVNFICFQGNHVDNISQNDPSNLVYDMVNKDSVDGLVIWASSYASRIGIAATQTFCDRFRPLPMVSIGMPLQGIPGILIDSYQAMADMMAHLVAEHGYRRIAYMHGPEGHYDSEERYRAYCDALRKYHIPFNPDIITPYGSWNSDRVAGELQLLLDERKATFEAMIAPSDILAADIMNNLQNRGIKVPEEIAVVGVNDEPTDRVLSPPLTSVDVKVYERGQFAVKMLLDLIQKNEVPPTVTLPSNIVIRRSCGCSSAAFKLTMLETANPPMSSLSFVKSHPEELVAVMTQTLNTEASEERQWLKQLLDNFILEIENEPSGQFIAILEDILVQVGKNNQEISPWLGVISTLRRQTAAGLTSSERARAEQLWYQAAVTIGDISERFLLKHQSQERSHHWDFHRFTQRLNTVFELSELLEMIAERLLNLGFSAFLLSLYEDPRTPAKQARLILAYHKKQRIPLEPEGKVFMLPELAPAELLDDSQPHSFIVVPLFFEENHLGFILLECAPKIDRIVYTALQIQLSSALWGTLLFWKQKQTEIALAEQAQELIRSNTELQQFAYVASHDLQEPLRKITVFSERLVQILAGSIDEKAHDYLDRMHSAARRMQTIINDLITYSRVTTKAHPFEKVSLTQVARESMLDLEIMITKKHGQIDIAELPYVEADPLQMRQLFQNLICNALKYCRAEISPIVKIYATTMDNQCQIIFEDNGIGIEEHYYDKIFQVFERLHGMNEYEGSGIGLAICKKIVARHDGSISVQSKLGQGSQFIVKLPLRRPRPNTQIC